MIRRFPQKARAIAQVHLDQSQQGSRSTKVAKVLPDTDSKTDLRPLVTPRTSRYESVVTKVVYRSDPTSIQYSDLTGRFSVVIQSGACYDLVFVCGNYIHVETLASRSQSDYFSAVSAGDLFFKSHGIYPIVERLDNETSHLVCQVHR